MTILHTYWAHTKTGSPYYLSHLHTNRAPIAVWQLTPEHPNNKTQLPSKVLKQTLGAQYALDTDPLFSLTNKEEHKLKARSILWRPSSAGWAIGSVWVRTWPGDNEDPILLKFLRLSICWKRHRLVHRIFWWGTSTAWIFLVHWRWWQVTFCNLHNHINTSTCIKSRHALMQWLLTCRNKLLFRISHTYPFIAETEVLTAHVQRTQLYRYTSTDVAHKERTEKTTCFSWSNVTSPDAVF